MTGRPAGQSRAAGDQFRCQRPLRCRRDPLRRSWAATSSGVRCAGRGIPHPEGQRRDADEQRPVLQPRGLTLVEVLATITIIAIVIPVACRGSALPPAWPALTRQRAQAVSLAESKLNELIITGEWQTADSPAISARPCPNYRWAGDCSQNWEEPDMVQIQVNVHLGVARARRARCS